MGNPRSGTVFVHPTILLCRLIALLSLLFSLEAKSAPPEFQNKRVGDAQSLRAPPIMRLKPGEVEMHRANLIRASSILNDSHGLRKKVIDSVGTPQFEVSLSEYLEGFRGDVDVQDLIQRQVAKCKELHLKEPPIRLEVLHEPARTQILKLLPSNLLAESFPIAAVAENYSVFTEFQKRGLPPEIRLAVMRLVLPKQGPGEPEQRFSDRDLDGVVPLMTSSDILLFLKRDSKYEKLSKQGSQEQFRETGGVIASLSSQQVKEFLSQDRRSEMPTAKIGDYLTGKQWREVAMYLNGRQIQDLGPGAPRGLFVDRMVSTLKKPGGSAELKDWPDFIFRSPQFNIIKYAKEIHKSSWAFLIPRLSVQQIFKLLFLDNPTDGFPTFQYMEYATLSQLSRMKEIFQNAGPAKAQYREIWSHLTDEQMKGLDDSFSEILDLLPYDKVHLLPTHMISRFYERVSDRDYQEIPLLYLTDYQLQALAEEAFLKKLHRSNPLHLQSTIKQELKNPDKINMKVFGAPFFILPPFATLSSAQLGSLSPANIAKSIELLRPRMSLEGVEKIKHDAFKEWIRRLKPHQISELSEKEINQYHLLQDFLPEQLPMLSDRTIQRIDLDQLESLSNPELYRKDNPKGYLEDAKEGAKKQKEILSHILLRLSPDQLRKFLTSIDRRTNQSFFSSQFTDVFPYLKDEFRKYPRFRKEQIRIMASNVQIPNPLFNKMFSELTSAEIEELFTHLSYLKNSSDYKDYLYYQTQKKRICALLSAKQIEELAGTYWFGKEDDQCAQGISSEELAKVNSEVLEKKLKIEKDDGSENTKAVRKVLKKKASHLFPSPSQKASAAIKQSLKTLGKRLKEWRKRGQVAPLPKEDLENSEAAQEVTEKVEGLNDLLHGLQSTESACRLQKLDQDDLNLGRVVSGLQVGSRIKAFSLEKGEDYWKRRKSFEEGPAKEIRFDIILNEFKKFFPDDKPNSDKKSKYHFNIIDLENLMAAGEGLPPKLGLVFKGQYDKDGNKVFEQDPKLAISEAKKNIEDLIEEMKNPEPSRGPKERVHKKEFSFELKYLIHYARKLPEGSDKQIDVLRGIVKLAAGLPKGYCFQGQLTLVKGMATQIPGCQAESGKMATTFSERALQALDLYREHVFNEAVRFEDDTQIGHTIMFYRDMAHHDLQVRDDKAKDEYEHTAQKDLTYRQLLQRFFTSIDGRASYNPFEIATRMKPILEQELAMDRAFALNFLHENAVVEYPENPSISYEDWLKQKDLKAGDENHFEDWKFEMWLNHQPNAVLEHLLYAIGGIPSSEKTLDAQAKENRSNLNQELDAFENAAQKTSTRRMMYAEAIVPRGKDGKPELDERVFRAVLLSLGVVEEINSAKPHIHTSFQDAVASGDSQKVHHTFANLEVPPNQPSFNGDSAMTLGVRHGITAVRNLLKNPRIDPNSVNEHGRSPLEMALNDDQTEIVKALLEDQRVEVKSALFENIFKRKKLWPIIWSRAAISTQSIFDFGLINNHWGLLESLVNSRKIENKVEPSGQANLLHRVGSTPMGLGDSRASAVQAITRKILEQAPLLATGTNEFNETPLLHAINTGNFPVASVLSEAFISSAGRMSRDEKLAMIAEFDMLIKRCQLKGHGNGLQALNYREFVHHLKEDKKRLTKKLSQVREPQ